MQFQNTDLVSNRKLFKGLNKRKRGEIDVTHDNTNENGGSYLLFTTIFHFLQDCYFECYFELHSYSREAMSSTSANTGMCTRPDHIKFEVLLPLMVVKCEQTLVFPRKWSRKHIIHQHEWIMLFAYTFASREYSPFPHFIALFQNGLTSSFSSNFYTQYPIMTMWNKFFFVLKIKN